MNTYILLRVKIFGLVLLFFGIPVEAQFLLEGSVEYTPYMGAQPNIVHGVSLAKSDSLPVIRHAYMVNKYTIGLTISAQNVERCGILPYLPTAEDSVILVGPTVPARLAEVCGVADFLPAKPHDSTRVHVLRYVYRNNEPLGWLVGRDYKYYWPIEKLSGQPFNVMAASNVNNYSITPVNIKKKSKPINPVKVYRKSKPHVQARVGPMYEHLFGEQHEVFLLLKEPLVEGKTYQISFNNKLKYLPNIKFPANTSLLRSEAIHVNLGGYHPLQKPKYAYLSMWLGDGGAVEYPLPLEFNVIKANSKEIVYSGKVMLHSSAQSVFSDSKRFGPDNYDRTNVYIMDFSSVTIPGTYEINIQGIGVSFPFQIDKNTYSNALRLQMMGYLHNRSGIELGPPYTTYKRPRNAHPADGVKVYSCDKTIFYDEARYKPHEASKANPFERIAQSIDLSTNNPNAWGGWMDAADYDRRWDHFRAVHTLLEVFEMKPDYYKNFNLNIPESDNHIPDIVDEARWGLDLFLRTQSEEGEIYYGVETVEHPNAGESSWNESLPLALVPGCPSIAYMYAATAAHMGIVLKPFDAALADIYINSALKAVEWADKHLNDSLYRKAIPPTAYYQTDLSAYLFEATGDYKWHERFLSAYKQIESDSSFVLTRDNYMGMARYVTKLKDSKVDVKVTGSITKLIIDQAHQLIEMTKKMSYNEYEDFAFNSWFVELYGSELLYSAYLITQDEKYIETIVAAGDYGMGANPLNAAFITGMGPRFVYGWDEEAIFNNTPYATGKGALGPFPFHTNRELPQDGFFWCKTKEQIYSNILYPAIREWPVRETYFELMKFPAMNEFTVQENFADQAYRWGLLHVFYNEIK